MIFVLASSKLWELVPCHMVVFWLLQKSFGHLKHSKNMSKCPLEMFGGKTEKKKQPPPPEIQILEGVEDKGFIFLCQV